MKNKKSTYIIVVTMLLAVSITAYFVFKKPNVAPPKNATKQQMCDFLISSKMTSGPTTTLLTFGDDYIIAWFNAAVAKQATFTLNNTVYNTNGGSVKK